MSNKKGQVVTLDLVVSLFGFMILFIFIIAIWSIYTNRLNDNIEQSRLELSAFQITDTLLRSSGIPVNWENNPNTTISFGLTDPSGQIDPDKLNAFLSSNYSLVASKMRIKRFGYNFSLTYLNNTVINSSGLVNDAEEEIVGVNRLILVGNETRKVNFILWKK